MILFFAGEVRELTFCILALLAGLEQEPTVIKITASSSRAIQQTTSYLYSPTILTTKAQKALLPLVCFQIIKKTNGRLISQTRGSRVADCPRHEWQDLYGREVVRLRNAIQRKELTNASTNTPQ